MITDSLRHSIEQAMDRRIQEVRPISGGSINQTAKINLSDGRACFLKWNQQAGPDMFGQEEKGLNLLATAHTSLHVPNVFTMGQSEQGVAFLVQEFIVTGQAGPHSAESFGQELARLHQHHATVYGLDHDNYIGRLPQSNHQHRQWINFFIEERIEPQLHLAMKAGLLSSGTANHFEALYQALPDIFPDVPPSLLHGDLWNGNYFYDAEGAPVIFDPAVYYGHREMELAFTRLFGGFATAFYQAYENSYPLEPGFSQRKNIYNLYPLLVHTNLFGGHYARQVQAIVRQF